MVDLEAERRKIFGDPRSELREQALKETQERLRANGRPTVILETVLRYVESSPAPNSDRELAHKGKLPF